MGIFSKSFNPATDLPDLSGKVILITGGNAGIGYATVKHLARRGAKVYMAARNESKAKEAIAQLKVDGLGPGNGEVIWIKLDLQDPRNAKKMAEEFMKIENRLDVIVTTLSTFSLISPLVLTRDLLPLLKQTAAEPDSDVRVVVVASDAHKFIQGRPRFRNLDELNNECKDSWVPSFARYGLSKLTNILFAKELQRRLLSQGLEISVISLHPGAVNTFSHKPPLKTFKWLVEILIYPFFVSPDVGGYTSAFAAASEEVKKDKEKYRGAYLVPVAKLSTGAKLARDDELAKELWDTVETFLKEKDI
ncbi:NAD(P)-binding protein [Leucogyrophana mollusca]|uniref:NAD(P)-binding protein n=1 Tax=Leucogyrophana mollusca TaxID=85980 RepID=A0ACB8BMZ1_9AGAM|nr:NAD(P)-binding protein [Leucogyrophana mollusca]